MGKQMEDYIQETSSVMVRNIEQRKELTKPLIGWLLKEGIDTRDRGIRIFLSCGTKCACVYGNVHEKAGPPDNAVCFYLL